MATLRDVPALVSALKDFDCNGTLFGVTRNGLYIVYSYGHHFPVAMRRVNAPPEQSWIVNRDKYSRTTTKHQSKVLYGVSMHGAPRLSLRTNEMKEVISAAGIKQQTSYHHIDNWRGYSIPANAVCGASDTGTWSDSPAPSDSVEGEIKAVQAKLRSIGVRSRQKFGETSNVFCGKRWLVVNPKDWERAVEFVNGLIPQFRFIHDAT